MDLRSVAVHHCPEMTGRFRCCRGRNVRANSSSTQRRAHGRHNESQYRQETAGPCQPASLWHLCCVAHRDLLTLPRRMRCVNRPVLRFSPYRPSASEARSSVAPQSTVGDSRRICALPFRFGRSERLLGAVQSSSCIPHPGHGVGHSHQAWGTRIILKLVAFLKAFRASSYFPAAKADFPC
jgi:hypothetical protein